MWVLTRERDLVLPARKDARSAQDAGQLDEAQKAQHADGAKQGGAVHFGRVDTHQYEVHGDDGDDVQREPPLEVVEHDALVRLDEAAALEDRLLCTREVGE